MVRGISWVDGDQSTTYGKPEIIRDITFLNQLEAFGNEKH